MLETLSQMTRSCALCFTRLDATNTSDEHVIPNAIGGRKTVRDFICKKCNSETGRTWDRELVEQLQLFCTMLNVRRQRGENQPLAVETVSGRQLTWHKDGSLTIRRPAFSKSVVDDRTHVSIAARTTNELRSILTDFSRSRPELDVDELISRAIATEEDLDEPLQFSHQFGGGLADRSMIKSCLALAHDAGLSSNDCPRAVEYLGPGGQACFGNYNETDVIVDRPEKAPLHCVYVQATPNTGMILSYVEYFGFRKMVACLSDDYNGPRRAHSYAVNPLTGEELKLQFTLNLQKGDLADLYDDKRLDYERLVQDLKELLALWHEIDRNRAISNALDEAIAEACLEMGLKSEDVIPEPMVPGFIGLMFRKMAPVLLRLKFGRTFTSEELRRVDELLG